MAKKNLNPDFALGFEENGLNLCQDKACEQKNRRRIRCNTPRTLLRAKRSIGKDLKTFYRNPNANSGLKGLFITFEGSEGCGKSTQSRLLCRYLKRLKFPVVFLREPGGTGISEKIRKLLLSRKSDGMEQVTEMLLYMASRAQTVSRIIQPELEKKKIVICDRFLDSTIAYQGYGLGMDIAAIKYVGKLATGGLSPDLTIFLDLPVKHGLKHRKDIEDRIESRAIAYHLRVRKGYLKLAHEHSRRIKIVKVAEQKAVTQERIRRLVEEKMKL